MIQSGWFFSCCHSLLFKLSYFVISLIFLHPDHIRVQIDRLVKFGLDYWRQTEEDCLQNTSSGWWNLYCVCENTLQKMGWKIFQLQNKILSHVSTKVCPHSPLLCRLSISHFTYVQCLCPQKQPSVSCGSWGAERTVAKQTTLTRLIHSRNLLKQNSFHGSSVEKKWQCLYVLMILLRLCFTKCDTNRLSINNAFNLCGDLWVGSAFPHHST